MLNCYRYCTLHGYPINFVLGYCEAAVPDPARIIDVQIAELQLQQPTHSAEVNNPIFPVTS